RFFNPGHSNFLLVSAESKSKSYSSHEIIIIFIGRKNPAGISPQGYVFGYEEFYAGTGIDKEFVQVVKPRGGIIMQFSHTNGQKRNNAALGHKMIKAFNAISIDINSIVTGHILNFRWNVVEKSLYAYMLGKVITGSQPPGPGLFGKTRIIKTLITLKCIDSSKRGNCER